MSLFRYNRETIVDGPNDPYAGFDRHNGEIAAFHLEGWVLVIIYLNYLS